MSLSLNFEPHSWYMGFAVEDCRSETTTDHTGTEIDIAQWYAVTDDGNTYRIIELEADTLKELKQQIKEYRSK